MGPLTSPMRKEFVVLAVALALGFAGGMVSRFLFQDRDPPNEVLTLVLEIARLRSQSKALEERVADLEETASLPKTTLALLAAKLGEVEDKIIEIKRRLGALEAQIEGLSELETVEELSEVPVFDITDFHVEEDGIIVFAIRNSSNVTLWLRPFVRCNEGKKYLWEYAIGSLYLGPGEEDYIRYNPYMDLTPGEYSFTLTHIDVEAISEKGEHLGSWDIPFEDYVATLRVEETQ